MQLTWPQVQIQPERRLSVPLEQKCKEEIVGVASVATQLSPVYELTHNVQKQSSLCPHVKTQTQLGSSWDLHLPSLSKFLGGLCSVSRETAKRSGAPRAGGRSEAGLRQVCQLADASAVSSTVLWGSSHCSFVQTWGRSLVLKF